MILSPFLKILEFSVPFILTFLVVYVCLYIIRDNTESSDSFFGYFKTNPQKCSTKQIDQPETINEYEQSIKQTDSVIKPNWNNILKESRNIYKEYLKQDESIIEKETKYLREKQINKK